MGGGRREGGSETGSGFFKGVGGESGTRVMSPPVGPRPPPSPRTPPGHLHTPLPLRKWPRHGQPPKSPLPWGAGATWAVGNRVAPAGKGIEDTGATREVPLGTGVRDFSEVGLGFGGRWVLKTARSGASEGTGLEAGSWTGAGDAVGRGEWSAPFAARAGVSAAAAVTGPAVPGALGAGRSGAGQVSSGRRSVLYLRCASVCGPSVLGRRGGQRASRAD